MENLAWRLMAIKTGAGGVGEEQKSGLIKDLGGTEDVAMKPLEQPREVQRRERQGRSETIFGESRPRSKSNPMLMNLTQTQAQVHGQGQVHLPGLAEGGDREPLSAQPPLHPLHAEAEIAAAAATKLGASVGADMAAGQGSGPGTGSAGGNVSRISSCLEALLESGEVHVDIVPRSRKSSMSGSKRTFERTGGSLGKGVLCMEYSDCGTSRYHQQPVLHS